MTITAVNLGVAPLFAMRAIETNLVDQIATEFDEQTYLNDVMGFDVRTKEGRAKLPLPLPDKTSWNPVQTPLEVERWIPNDLSAGYIFQDNDTGVLQATNGASYIFTDICVLFYFRAFGAFEKFEWCGKMVDEPIAHMALRAQCYNALITNVVLKQLKPGINPESGTFGIYDVLLTGNYAGAFLLNVGQEPTIGYSKNLFSVQSLATVPGEFC